MSTRLTLMFAEDGGASTRVAVNESFEAVAEIVVPTAHPTSSLEARERLILTQGPQGDRVLIRPEYIAMVEDNRDLDDG